MEVLNIIVQDCGDIIRIISFICNPDSKSSDTKVAQAKEMFIQMIENEEGRKLDEDEKKDYLARWYYANNLRGCVIELVWADEVI